MTAKEKVEARWPQAWASISNLAVRIFRDKQSEWGDPIGLAFIVDHGQDSLAAAWADAAQKMGDL